MPAPERRPGYCACRRGASVCANKVTYGQRLCESCKADPRCQEYNVTNDDEV